MQRAGESSSDLRRPMQLVVTAEIPKKIKVIRIEFRQPLEGEDVPHIVEVAGRFQELVMISTGLSI
jgi:hypothetical protein